VSAPDPTTEPTEAPGIPRDSRPSAAPDRLIWRDGEWVPWQDATVHVLSHSLQRGSLVFDYMSVRQTPRGAAVFRLDLHVQRMLASCALMGLPIRMSADEIAAAILETVRRNPGARAVKACAYFASVEVDVVPLDDRVTVAIAAYDPKADIIERLPVARPEPKRSVGLWVEKKIHNRREDIVSPQAKVSANYASTMTAKARAKAEGYDEILLVDEDGFLAEGPTSNLFVVDERGALLTPPEKRVLLGVTRASILELARAEGLDVREEPILPTALDTAREVFLTGTTAGVLPAHSVDGRPVGDACPGPVAARLRERFAAAEAGEDPAFAHWLTFVD
jgi:branched-chain amino acid aminotransferase